MPTKIPVRVEADQFDELCRPTMPLAAVEELIWNGLDAEATAVDVAIDRTEMDAVKGVTVTDNGHGMTNAEALRDFAKLGGSWKKGQKRSRNDRRALHGAKGQGRFRAFALGAHAEWSSVALTPGGLERTVISGSLQDAEFTVGDPESLATGTPSTVVGIASARETASPLLSEEAPQWLVRRLAPYLARYTDVTVSYDSKLLDPAALIDRETTITLDEVDGSSPAMRIVEWQPQIVKHRSSLILCDAEGVALEEITEGVPGARKITAYVSWDGFAERAHDLQIAEMGHPILGPIVETARRELDAYLEARSAEERRGVVADWKARHVYPYTDAPTSSAQKRERQLFDVVATTAVDAIPTNAREARLSLRLLKEALEQSPASLHRVLSDVLELTPQQLEDFDQLLRTTTLPAVIATTTKVLDRLTFLDDLHRLLFDADGKQQVTERAHLHEILANDRTWIFGEEYALVASEKTLTKVLETHLDLLDDEGVPRFGPVTDLTGNNLRRIDLMLSRAVLNPTGRRHLVVELKRPSIRLGAKEHQQITNYALTIARDERFSSHDVEWDFWLVGDDYDGYIEELAHQDGQPEGVVFQKHPVTIRVRRWAEILEENRQRLHFYQENLEFTAKDDESIDATLRRLLPPDDENR